MTYVCYEIDIRHDLPQVPDPTMKKPLIVPGVDEMLISLIKAIGIITHHSSISEELIEPPVLPQLRPHTDIEIVALPGPSP